MLQSLLAEGRPLLADGATGTNLFAMGLTSGDLPELWNAEHPDRIESLHRAFVDAGSDIILTNSFGANRRRLMLHKLEGRTRELNRLAAGIARKVADKARRPVVVAGSVGPTGDLLAPLGPLERRRGGRNLHRADRGPARGRRGRRLDRDHVGAGGNARGGGRRGQVRHAVHGHRELRHRRPHHDGRCALPRSASLSRLSTRRQSRIGANCGVGASDLLAAILGMKSGAALIAKANAGVPQWHGAEIHYSGTPELMETIRGSRRGLRRAHRRRLLRQYARPCRGDAARPRRPQSRRASGRGGDRRGARPPRRAASGGERRQPAAPAGADVNSKAKQRAWSHAAEQR